MSFKIPPSFPPRQPEFHGANHDFPASKKGGKRKLKETSVSRSKISPLRTSQPSQVVFKKSIRDELALEKDLPLIEDEIAAAKAAKQFESILQEKTEIRRPVQIRKEDFDKVFVHQITIEEGLKFLKDQEKGDYIIIKHPQDEQYYLLVKDMNGKSKMKEKLSNKFHALLENDFLMHYCKKTYGGIRLVGR